MVKENLAYVEEQITKACERAGRNRDEVTLIAVSKTKPVSLVDEVIDNGIREFGENKVQEIMDKYETVKTPVNWHMIGHLQRNKVKYIVDKVCLIHSVDSYRLAEMIDQEAAKKGVRCDILIEVNIAKEDTKYGVMEDEVIPLIEQISKLSNIRIKGLMTIAPFVEYSEKNRVHFRNLRNLYVDIKTKNIDNVDMKILSMGMTNDYEVAIEEGATMVRVGTGIFGQRN
ncbi:YggS family pyridoxal phosphate-dependent enzyme [Anaerosporobacter sp.]|uniref:YggS family pyridoxal phosphate-dependent enzyme n=1 Tax=Anaerosporobacter sp. TaxID=1872529 RepID=UPI0025F89B7A|nr:YggS family pyridoxal phosphate-dependent enzyme [Anaerosporobacter sp.]